MVVEFGCVAAVSEVCKIVAEERTGLIREPPYAQGFAVKITGEPDCTKNHALSLSWAATFGLAVQIERVRVPPIQRHHRLLLCMRFTITVIWFLYIVLISATDCTLSHWYCTWNSCHTGPGSVFIQSTHTGRLSRAGRAAAQRASGGAEMMKAAVLTLVVLIAVFSFLDWEEV